METVLIFCVEQLDNGTSFAIREDNGESVFVPSTIANRVNLQIGDSVNAKLVANAKLPEKTPWFAVRVDPASSEGTTPPVKNDDLKSRVRDVIYGSKTYFTLDDVWDIGAIAAMFAMSNRLANMADIPPNAEFYSMAR